MSLLELLHLVEAELERRLALEDGDEDLELLSLGQHLGDRGDMVSKGPSVTVTISPTSNWVWTTWTGAG